MILGCWNEETCLSALGCVPEHCIRESNHIAAENQLRPSFSFEINNCHLNLILPLHNLGPCAEDIWKKLLTALLVKHGEMLKFLHQELVDLQVGGLNFSKSLFTYVIL